MNHFRTARNVAVVTVLSLGQMIVQFLITSVWASYYRLGTESDALAAALSIPTFATAAITGSLAYVLVPELMKQFKDVNSLGGWKFASAIGILATLVSGLAVLFIAIAADWIASSFFPQQDTETRRMTVECLRILAWQPLLTGIVSWAAAIHNSRHSFIVPAMAGLVGTAGSLWFIYQFGSREISMIAWAINLGSIVSVVIHVFPLVGKLSAPSFVGVALFPLAAAYAPLLVGTAIMRFDPVVDRILADALANEGATATINFAQKIMLALLALGTSTLSLIAFSQLADRHSSQGLAGFREHFAIVWRRLLILVIPITIGVGVFAPEITGDLLQRGEFSREDTLAVATMIRWMMGLFVGASLGEMLARSFYVLGDTKTPTIVGMASLLVGWLMKWWLLDMMGASGIAVGVSVYYMLSAAAMLGILVLRQGRTILTGSTIALLRAATCSSIACIGCFAIYWTTMLQTWGAAPMGVLIYAIGMILLRDPDAVEATKLFVDKVRRKHP